ncbi:MAG: DoxX family protein [Acidobacteria bacterium]|nr:DoxX family protein [Acidobacteriota bacterium]
MGRPQALGLALLRIALGVFFLFEGLGKLGWFASSGVLISSLNTWLKDAHPVSRVYIETVCLPGVEVFARLVPLGELATGLALILGVFARPAAAVALLMVLNFHVASGALFKYSFMTNAFGLPVFGGLLALAVGAVALPLSLRK